MWFYVSRIIAYIVVSALAGVVNWIFEFPWIMLVLIYIVPKIVIFLLVAFDISDQPKFVNNVVIDFDKAFKFYHISKYKYNYDYLLKLRYLGKDDTCHNLYFKSLTGYIRYWILVMNKKSRTDETVYEEYVEEVQKDVDKFHKKTMAQLEKASKQAQKEIELTLEHNRTAK